MIQKAAALGNWWLAASLRECACSCITSPAVFWENIKSPRWLRPHYSPDLAPCDFWLFPKLKSPLKRKRFQTINEIQEIWWGSWWWLGELREVPRCLLWRRLRHHHPMYNVSYIFFKKCLIFFIKKRLLRSYGSRESVSCSQYCFILSEWLLKGQILYKERKTYEVEGWHM